MATSFASKKNGDFLSLTGSSHSNTCCLVRCVIVGGGSAKSLAETKADIKAKLSHSSSRCASIAFLGLFFENSDQSVGTIPPRYCAIICVGLPCIIVQSRHKACSA